MCVAGGSLAPRETKFINRQRPGTAPLRPEIACTDRRPLSHWRDGGQKPHTHTAPKSAERIDAHHFPEELRTAHARGVREGDKEPHALVVGVTPGGEVQTVRRGAHGSPNLLEMLVNGAGRAHAHLSGHLDAPPAAFILDVHKPILPSYHYLQPERALSPHATDQILVPFQLFEPSAACIFAHVPASLRHSEGPTFSVGPRN